MLRLHSLPASDFYSARNSLCQRPPGPESIMTVELDTSGLAVGDTAGLALLSSPYAWIGVVKTAEGTALQMFDGGGGGAEAAGGAAPAPDQCPHHQARPHPPAHLWLRVHCNFDTDEAIFSWSADGKAIHAAGQALHHDLPVDDLPGRAPRVVQLQHLRPARRLCRL